MLKGLIYKGQPFFFSYFLICEPNHNTFSQKLYLFILELKRSSKYLYHSRIIKLTDYPSPFILLIVSLIHNIEFQIPII